MEFSGALKPQRTCNKFFLVNPMNGITGKTLEQCRVNRVSLLFQHPAKATAGEMHTLVSLASPVQDILAPMLASAGKYSGEY